MNVLESRTGRPLRLRPWVLLVGAAVVIAVVLLLTLGSSSPTHSGSAGTPSTSDTNSGSGSGSGGSATASFDLKTTIPAPGAQNVAPNTTISLTFSAPVSLRQAAPQLSPDIAGKWVQTNATTLSYVLASPLIPSSQVVVTIPGGAHGLRSKDGATLSTSHSVAFGVAAGDTLRLQQLLAQLNYLPVAFAPSGPAPTNADLAEDQAGSFSWRWPGLPSELTSQWTQGSANEITRAAVEAFETQNNIGVDGIAGPTVWTALINDVHQQQAQRHALRLRRREQGGPAEPDPVEQRGGAVRRDPHQQRGAGCGHGRRHLRRVRARALLGDEGHQRQRLDLRRPQRPLRQLLQRRRRSARLHPLSYGTPQSNGQRRDELRRDAALVWPLTPIGTLVTVVGPGLRHGAPPPTTSTTTTVPFAPTTTATARAGDRRPPKASGRTRHGADGLRRAGGPDNPEIGESSALGGWRARPSSRPTSSSRLAAGSGAGAPGRGPSAGARPPRRRPRDRTVTCSKYSRALGRSPARSYRSASRYHWRTWRSDGLFRRAFDAPSRRQHGDGPVEVALASATDAAATIRPSARTSGSGELSRELGPLQGGHLSFGLCSARWQSISTGRCSLSRSTARTPRGARPPSATGHAPVGGQAPPGPRTAATPPGCLVRHGLDGPQRILIAPSPFVGAIGRLRPARPGAPAAGRWRCRRRG